jgi:hypothetical protein
MEVGRPPRKRRVIGYRPAMLRLFRFLPAAQKQEFLLQVMEAA